MWIKPCLNFILDLYYGRLVLSAVLSREISFNLLALFMVLERYDYIYFIKINKL